MIEATITISSNLLEMLDLLDRDVKAAARDGVHKTLLMAYDNIMAAMDSYGWSPPQTTGNLRASTGFLMAGGGKYNIFNYNSARAVGKASNRAEIPAKPTSPYEGLIFSLAPYAVYQEYGTTRNTAHPFFFSEVQSAASYTDGNVLEELYRRGAGTSWYGGKGLRGHRDWSPS